MIVVKDPSRCCGCSACHAVCPHDAVIMNEDRLGFLYPVVDSDKCVDCGLCESVCAFSSDVERHAPLSDSQSVVLHAARHTNNDVVSFSQSGGVFTALSDVVLNEGGVVYGATFDEDYDVCHSRASTKAERDRFRGSKYVQSNMKGVFRDVRDDLKAGFPVMFCGTPCQVAGLKSYIPESLQDKLYTVDFICHGVPSPSIWRDYVTYMGRKGKIEKVVFRDKNAAGWKGHLESFTFDDGKVMTGETYRILFHKNIMLRHSCGVCPYDIANRRADITIGDFWGVDEALPSFDGASGTSMIICGTEKGRSVIDRSAGSLEMRNTAITYGFMSRYNPNLIRPTTIYKDRNKLEDEYAARGFLHVARKWSDLGIRYRLWRIKVFVKRLFRIER